VPLTIEKIATPITNKNPPIQTPKKFIKISTKLNPLQPNILVFLSFSLIFSGNLEDIQSNTSFNSPKPNANPIPHKLCKNIGNNIVNAAVIITCNLWSVLILKSPNIFYS